MTFMAWLVVNKNGQELISPSMPERDTERGEWYCCFENQAGFLDYYGIELPKGTIKKIIGFDLTWDNDAFKIE